MRMNHLHTKTSLVMGIALASAASAAPLEADLLLTHGDIYTPTGWAQAMAVKNGVIIAVGDDAAVAQHKGTKTQVMDLNGAAVMPGLHDMHVHPIGAGQLHTQCVFPQGLPPQKIVDAVKACVSKHAKGEWVTGGQWDGASFGNQPIDRTLLDKVAPDNPVALMDISVHALWVNSKALQLAGITAKTPSPAGGVIERDAKGQPSGVLRESARALVQKVMPPPTIEGTAKALNWSLSEMLSHGITSFTDAGLDEMGMQAYTKLFDAGVLKQRVRGCIAWHTNLFSAAPAKTDPIEQRNLYVRDRFKPECVKIILDGVPTEGHTAAMLEPYTDVAQADEARAQGMLFVPAGELKAAVIKFDKMGLTVKMHAAGDGAVRAGLDAIEAARQANGMSGRLHELSHNSFVNMADIARARGLAATFEMSPYIWFPNPIIPSIVHSVGPERMQRWIPVKDALDAGALVEAGSDWAVVPSVNPWLAIETLVTRQQPGGGGEVLGAAEKITLQQAFELFTVNASRETGEANRLGSIEKGMLADVLVLDRNPFKIAVTQIHDTQVKMVFINGELVHRAQ